MNAAALKRLRPAALMVFAVGLIAAFPALIFLGNKHIFLVGFLISSLGLAFFAFTEGFLYGPPDRARYTIWLGRICFVGNAAGALFLLIAAVRLAL